MGYKNVRVLTITSDLKLYNALSGNLSSMSDIEGVMNFSNLVTVETSLVKNKFNVIILDLDNKFATYQILKRLIEKHKLLVILTASSQTASAGLLQGGIRDFFLKPHTVLGSQFNNFADAIKIRIRTFTNAAPSLSYTSQLRTVDINQTIITIASSTGGTEALEKIFKELPSSVPPILVVQHMPSGFTKFFADRLNMICPMEVKEAANNDYLMKGQVLIAPADSHMTLVRRNSKLAVECFVGTKINGVMPAADVLFDSIAPIMRGNVVGVILTGMGADGARGMLKMHINGAKTIGQDKESCVVYGMPKVAHDLGAVDFQLPLVKIPEKIMSLVGNM